MTGCRAPSKTGQPGQKPLEAGVLLDLAIHSAEWAPPLPVPLTSDHAEEPVTFDNWDPAVSAGQSTEVLKSRDVSERDD
jgi:hypothetical protein